MKFTTPVTRPADLKSNTFVVVVGFCSDPNDEPQYDQFSGRYHRYPKPAFDGSPMRVLHCELPFVIVESVNGRGVLDLRVFRLRTVSKEYVKLYDEGVANFEASSGNYSGLVKNRSRLIKKRKKKTKPDPRACPRCGRRMTLIRRQKQPGKWFNHCPDCDCDFGEVSVK